MSDLLSQVSPIIKSVIDLLVATDLLQVTLTYRRHDGQTFNETTRVGVATYTESDVQAATATHTTKSATAFGGAVEVGARFFLIKSIDIPAGASMKDQIIMQGRPYRITDIHWLLSLGAIFTVAGGD